MKLKIPNSLFFLLFLLLGVAGLIVGLYSKSIPSFNPSEKYVIVLDAGHGTPDGGAVGINGTLEKDINLSIVLKLQEILESRGAYVILTRTGDMGIFDDPSQNIHDKKVSDMKNRLKIINESNADLFISVHMNSFPKKSSNGLNVFYSKNHPETEELALYVQRRIADITGVKTHAVKTASEKLFLMKNPVPPALLIECGFISNPEEEKLLNTDEYQSKIAFAIADALDEFLSQNKEL